MAKLNIDTDYVAALAELLQRTGLTHRSHRFNQTVFVQFAGMCVHKQVRRRRETGAL